MMWTIKNSKMKMSVMVIFIGILLFAVSLVVPSSAATVYILSDSTQDLYKNGISHTGTDEAVVIIEDDFTITGINRSGISSAGPLTIKGESGKILSITVLDDSESACGITAPSVAISGGSLEINAGGNSTALTCGIYASEGNVAISGGIVKASADSSTSHKNKGIYANDSVVISGGTVKAFGNGGANSFGIDGDGADGQGGILISGGVVSASAAGGGTRNYGIDSKFGRVLFTGDAGIIISEDESGENSNYAYNINITDISGNNVVLFTAEGPNSSYRLRKNAVLEQDFSLIPGKTFEIPEGLTLTVSKGIDFAADGAVFVYETEYTNKQGQKVYTSAPVDPDLVASPVPAGLVLAGIGAAAVFIRRK